MPAKAIVVTAIVALFKCFTSCLRLVLFNMWCNGKSVLFYWYGAIDISMWKTLQTIKWCSVQYEIFKVLL